MSESSKYVCSLSCWNFIDDLGVYRPFRAFSYNGVIYTVIHPTPAQHLPGYPIVDPHLNLDGRDLRQPLFATNKCPEIAYMVRNFKTENAFLARLHCDRDTVHLVKVDSGSTRGYMLAPSVAKSWRSLESCLLRTSDILFDTVRGRPEMLFPFDPFWPNPSEYRYKDVYPTEAAAKAAALKGRDACALLAARCTMAIALCTVHPDTNPPRWVIALMKQKVPSAWIDALRASVIADLSPDLRVGAIVNPLGHGHESATAWVDHVPCMIRANLPVYIAWPKDTAEVIRKYPFLRDYLPKLCDIQQVIANDAGRVVMHPRPQVVSQQVSFRWAELSRRSFEHVLPKDEPPARIPHGEGQLSGESYQAFFARREGANRKRAEKETSEQRESRMRRQQKADSFNRPTRPTRVFLWKVVGDVDDQVPAEVLFMDYRAYVKPTAVAEVWGSHPPAHKRYDAWLDEWDICEKLAPEERLDDPWDELDEPDVPQPAPSSYDQSRNVLFESELLLLYDETGSFAPYLVHLGAVARVHYGLVPVVQPNAHIDYDAYAPPTLQKFIGYLAEDINKADASVVKAMCGLVHSLLENKDMPTAPGLIWDLNPACDHYLLHSAQRHPSMEPKAWILDNRKRYRISYADRADDYWWELVVDNATTVLELYRQWDITNRRDALRYLVARGIPYYTLFCPDRRDRITYIRPEVPTLGWRISGTVLNRYDYQAYERRAYDILARPRGRAALAQGGIVWRLASEIMSADWHDVAFEGPSTDVYHTGQPFRPYRGDDYYDDALTLEELDVSTLR